MPVSAEKIESRLNEIWRAQASDNKAKNGKNSQIRLCLANVLIISDSTSRVQAEKLAHRLAAIQPSRILNIVIDDDKDDYQATVSTACDFSRGKDSIVCWEMIEIQSDSNDAKKIPGAIRSLLVDSVPVITIDFRPSQSQPLFDATVLSLSDYYFVNAEIVPTGKLMKRFLPLRWYRTFPLRELMSEFIASLLYQTPGMFPSEYHFNSESHPERLDILLGGWIVHRLGNKYKTEQQSNGVDIIGPKKRVKLRWNADSKDKSLLLELKFDDGSIAELRIEEGANGGPSYSICYGKIKCTKNEASYPLEQYIIESTRNSIEFLEYDATREVVRETAIG